MIRQIGAMLATLTALTIWAFTLPEPASALPPKTLAAIEQPVPLCRDLTGATYMACAGGVQYWQDIDPTIIFDGTVTFEIVPVEALPDSSGWASTVDSTCHVRVRVDYAQKWNLWAHELGHCLGLAHDNDGLVHLPDYYGVMDYHTMWDENPSTADDIRLLEAQTGGNDDHL